jgi:hypothetical protein
MVRMEHLTAGQAFPSNFFVILIRANVPVSAVL